MLNDKYSFNRWLDSEFKRQRTQKTYKKKFIGSRLYPHFDSTIDLFDAEQRGLLEYRIVSQGLAERWNFYPFIKKEQRNRRYRHKNKNAKYYGTPFASRNQKKYTHIKSRPIMYASHQDACLYAYVSFLLSEKYEDKINEKGLSRSVIAYRSIKGKNNIDFAHNAFNFLKKHKGYTCILIDVKSFFDTIPHEKLFKATEALVGSKLPDDVNHVLSNITRYRYVIDDEVIKTLKKNKRKYFVKDKTRGFKICRLEDFNELINNKKHIRTNRSKVGIPQGSPVSGLLANVSLVDFDTWLQSRLSSMSFYFYQRYSDDIVIICPQNEAVWLYAGVKSQLNGYGLTLSSKKTEAFSDNGRQIVNTIKNLEPFNSSSRQNMQYLGLEWNGKQIVLRPRTLSKRLRPKKILTAKYWNYHRSAVTKVRDRALSRQFDRMRKTAKRISELRNNTP